MIVCKPKAGSLFSLGIFSMGGIAVGGFSLNLIITEANTPWYHYLATLTLLPLALVILLRTFWGYKVLTLGKQRVTVKYPFRFNSFTIQLKDISNWNETNVKTKTGHYREIEIKSPEKKVSINIQEHSGYLDALEYLKKKAAKSKNK